MADLPHILVVDDEPDMCWLLENLLVGEGYRVTSAMDGKEALRLTKTGDFKMALIDLNLPDINGIELSRLIREVDPEIKPVVLSGYLYREDKLIQQCLSEGVFVGFIGKPCDADEILQVVKKALGIDTGGADML